MTYQQVTLINGFPYDVTVINDMSAELASRSRAGLGIIKRHNRTTASSTTTTEVGVVRIDNVPVSVGRLYRIWTSAVIFNSTVANDLIDARIRVNLAGTATTSSTQLGGLVENAHSAGSSQKTKAFTVPWVPGSSGNASVLLSVARSLGTGNVNLIGQAGYPIDLVIEDCGLDPGASGVNI
ncbi:hypothetical protein ACFFX1_55045 [Dactylosporangium sucinum]|uniref:Uncharacterized protein n=1 Tax=Dactylosporangium sucinum TaxID=1424081 RepID=A0A917U329_9ACTN|nr:hypothetical protein [Dactylosporangium sucinum]GGM53148.1 hypothetical protein GCM10007977_063510 [Dactylosporangium sucinum]